MHQATTYDQWIQWAQAQDKFTGAERWKQEEHSDHYDYKVIRYRLEELIEVRRSGDPQALLYYLNEGLHGNMGGMGSAALYGRAKFGTKQLINDYLDELTSALDEFEAASEQDISTQEKLAYFRRASVCFGRSAMMFSGAGSLGAFHVGVAKELASHDLLPRVISGASAGSVVAAVIGTHTPEELAAVFAPKGIGGSFEALTEAPGLPGERTQIQLEDLIRMVEATIPDLTFLEAFERTNHHINITVAPSELHQRSRMLNASTAPNAFVREAVIASCAIPGVFPAVTLAAKDSNGNRRPYVASRQFVDGSITDDMPSKRIARQYGVNHFISSQANPIVLWALNEGMTQDSLISRWAAIYQRGWRDWLRAIYPSVMASVRHAYPINTYTRFWFSLLTQEYTADINLLPNPRALDPTKLLAQLTTEETEHLIRLGQEATWPKVEMIRNCTRISRHIDAALLRLEGPTITAA